MTSLRGFLSTLLVGIVVVVLGYLTYTEREHIAGHWFGAMSSTQGASAGRIDGECPGGQVSRDATRLALVIGNGAYASGWPALSSPRRDAGAMAQKLSELKFAMVGSDAVIDADLATLNGCIERLSSAAKRATLVVFYFSGHGIQTRDGRTWLIPIGAGSPEQTDRPGISLDDLMDRLSANNAAKVIILDACRDAAQGELKGLARPDDRDKFFVFYAAAAGTLAEDTSRQDLSPFTQALIDRLNNRADSLAILSSRVIEDVQNATGRRQTPAIYSATPAHRIALRPMAPITDCDRLTLMENHPGWPATSSLRQLPAAGQFFTALDKAEAAPIEKAMEACRKARLSFPDEPRFGIYWSYEVVDYLYYFVQRGRFNERPTQSPLARPEARAQRIFGDLSVIIDRYCSDEDSNAVAVALHFYTIAKNIRGFVDGEGTQCA